MAGVAGGAGFPGVKWEWGELYLDALLAGVDTDVKIGATAAVREGVFEGGGECLVGKPTVSRRAAARWR